MDLYIAGVEEEGTLSMSTAGQILYLNGPGVASLKTGTVQRVVRPEGKISDPISGAKMGIYYQDIGTIQIEAVEQESATARVLTACRAMLKGDLVTSHSEKPGVEFGGKQSNALTPIPQNGLVSLIIVGKDDIQEMVAGNVCYIGLGGRDGVRAGDRFTIFRPYPEFNSHDMIVGAARASTSYASARNLIYQSKINTLLSKRKLPPQVLGDMIVVDIGDGVSAGKIINSLFEIHVGDFVVKR
jgi:hypothetical protein